MSFGRTNLFHPPANHSLIYLQHSYFTKGSQNPILGLLNKRLPHSNDTKNELKILQTCEVTNSSPIHFCKFPTTLFLRNILIVLKILKEFLLSFFDLSFFCLIQTLLSSIIRNVITDFFFQKNVCLYLNRVQLHFHGQHIPSKQNSLKCWRISIKYNKIQRKVIVLIV